MKPSLRKSQILEIFGREPETLDELAQCVVAVINHNIGAKSLARVVGFAWDVRYSDKVSNTHHSPEGYSQNWGSRALGIPTGYPGWSGRVWIRYASYPANGFGSAPFEKTLTHPGTGGAGAYGGSWEKISHARWNRYGHKNSKDAYPAIECYSWDYKFYEFDWPELARWVEKQQIWSELSNKPLCLSHKFEWNDAAVAAADLQFIAECAKIKETTAL